MNTRILATITVLIGLLWGCAPSDPLVDNARQSVQRGNFEAAIQSADEAIALDSSNTLAYYYRGVAYGALAEDIMPPSNRVSYYENMKESFSNANHWGSRAEEKPGELVNIPNVVNASWAMEHNSGAEILMSDSLQATMADPIGDAIAHFNNAIIIQPDSAITYIVLSSTHFREGDLDKATEVFEIGFPKIQEPLVDDYDYLINLYLIAQRFDDVRELSTEARETYPDEPVFVQYLADSYLQTGQIDEAISLVRELIAQDPDNPQYYLVLGTQIYQSATAMSNELSALYDRILRMEDQARNLRGAEREEVNRNILALRNEASEKEAEVERLTQIAITEINEVVRLRPDDDGAYNILGIIYQNRAAGFFEKRNAELDNTLAMQYDDKAKENLRMAMVNYEKAVEFAPDETEYWQALFQVYTTLGMQEKALEAMEKAGMDD
jgi:tetratricopeptide (TPR) repeat protein